MGTEITLEIEKLHLTYSKNTRGMDHGPLFQERDRKPVDPDEEDEGGGDPNERACATLCHAWTCWVLPSEAFEMSTSHWRSNCSMTVRPTMGNRQQGS